MKKNQVRHGGRRPGAGRKKGKISLAKEQAREFVRERITEVLGPLVDAQIENAIGIRHLMVRDPETGRFERVTGSKAQIDQALKSKKNAFWIYTKDPSVQAFSDLLNRALDKPPEQIQLSGEDGGPVVIRWAMNEEEANG